MDCYRTYGCTFTMKAQSQASRLVCAGTTVTRNSLFDMKVHRNEIRRFTEMKYADMLVQYVVTKALESEDPLPQKHMFFICTCFSNTPTFKYIKVVVLVQIHSFIRHTHSQAQ